MQIMYLKDLREPCLNVPEIVNQRIYEYGNAMWLTYYACDPYMDIPKNCLTNVSSSQCWSISELYPDLVEYLHEEFRP